VPLPWADNPELVRRYMGFPQGAVGRTARSPGFLTDSNRFTQIAFDASGHKAMSRSDLRCRRC
jgi:hypothetical protein